ncbi:MAG: hypothetical protein CMO01_05960 [Thalassobius sp.]|nr:hypothetical protein [Thalassovita sp.]
MDKSTKTLIHYEWKTFTRNKFQLLLLAITFVFALYAIYYGKSEINAQLDTIEAVKNLEEKEFAEYKASFQKELVTLEQEQTHDIASRPAYAWYRHGYHAILYPHALAPLAIGQRDLFRYYYRLTGMSLHYQLYENELANPVNLLAGNFDLSFVLIYLFPLLIITFCYGLFSSEKENGTLALLKIQVISIRKIMLIKLAFYLAIITGLALLVSLIGILSTANPIKSENLMASSLWLIGAIVYCVFWFAVMFVIISFRKSSSFNAITAAGCWLFFLIVIPGMLNVIVTVKYPVSSVTLAGLTRRTGLENEDDEKEAKEVITEFLHYKPELADSDSLIKNNLMPKAYAAFTSLKDIHNQEEVDYYNSQINKRNKWIANFYWLSPAVNMQEIFSQITETDLNTFLVFQDALVSFHRDISDFYFKRLFWDKPILLEDYSELPVFKMPKSDNRYLIVFTGLSKISLIALLAFIVGYIKINSISK